MSWILSFRVRNSALSVRLSRFNASNLDGSNPSVSMWDFKTNNKNVFLHLSFIEMKTTMFTFIFS